MDSWAQYNKHFMSVMYEYSGLFQPSPMFLGKARVYQKSTLQVFKCSTRLVPGISHKHYTRLEKLAREKQVSLLGLFVNYDNKKFYSIGPW
jgi:hypothetical protein